MKSQRLHSKVILDNPATACLYYLLRGRDEAGQGWITISMKYLQDALNRGRRAIIRRIKKGMGIFFQGYEIKGDRLYVKYISLDKVKAHSDGVFSSAKVSSNTFLSIKDAKGAAYGIAISRQQDACRKAIRKGGKAKSDKQVFDPIDIAKVSRYRCCEHIKGKGTDNVKVFLPKHIQVVGASQLTLASALGKSRSTVIAWCKHIPSIKVWKSVPLDTPHRGDIYRCYRISQTGRKMGRAYKRMPNLYYPTLVINVLSAPRMEGHNDHKRIDSPAQVTVSTTAGDTISYILSLKAPRSFASLSDKLLFHFNKEALLKLAYAIMVHIKPEFWGREGEVHDRLGKADVATIAGHIQRTIEDIHEDYQHEAKGKLKVFMDRLKRHKHPTPPTARKPYYALPLKG